MMSKVTITIEDTEDGTVSIELDFDPPGQGSEDATPAQYTALRMIQIVKGLGEDE